MYNGDAAQHSCDDEAHRNGNAIEIVTDDDEAQSDIDGVRNSKLI